MGRETLAVLAKDAASREVSEEEVKKAIEALDAHKEATSKPLKHVKTRAVINDVNNTFAQVRTVVSCSTCFIPRPRTRCGG